jgi:hypothetical protein
VTIASFQRAGGWNNHVLELVQLESTAVPEFVAAAS